MSYSRRIYGISVNDVIHSTDPFIFVIYKDNSLIILQNYFNNLTDQHLQAD